MGVSLSAESQIRFHPNLGSHVLALCREVFRALQEGQNQGSYRRMEKVFQQKVMLPLWAPSRRLQIGVRSGKGEALPAHANYLICPWSSLSLNHTYFCADLGSRSKGNVIFRIVFAVADQIPSLTLHNYVFVAVKYFLEEVGRRAYVRREKT